MSDAAARQHSRPVLCRTATTVSMHFAGNETQSAMDLRQPDGLNLEYTRTMMGFLLFIPEPAAIAMVGLGGGSLAKFCHRYLPGTRIDVVEINPHVIALRDEFHVPPDSGRFTVREGDGAVFVRSPPRRYDVLLVDGYDDSGLPAALSTQQFYTDCAALLGPEGMLVVNLHCGRDRRQQQVARIRRSFDDAVLAVNDTKGNSSVVFASTGHLAARTRAEPLRRPHNLDNDAWNQLRGTLARVQANLHDNPP